mgnify:CR=1 FL=1
MDGVPSGGEASCDRTSDPRLEAIPDRRRRLAFGRWYTWCAVKDSFGYFLLGVFFGVAGTILVERLRKEGVFSEDSKSISERVRENLSELENRLEMVKAEFRV